MALNTLNTIQGGVQASYSDKYIKQALSNLGQRIGTRGDSIINQDFKIIDIKNYNVDYFESLYFQLAPVLAIPVYQQQKPVEYIYQRKFEYNNTAFEHEVMANAIDNRLLMPEQCATELILKTDFLTKNENADKVQIVSHGFRTINHTSYISVYGGDGRFHEVPVHWVEYIPVQTNNVMEVSRRDISKNRYETMVNDNDYNSYLNKYAAKGGAAFQKGLLSILLNQGIMKSDIDSLNNIFK